MENNDRPVAKCRFCQTSLLNTFIDLGMSPLCEDHVKPDELNKMEPFYPLHAYVCHNCYLVQVEEFVSPAEIYNDYAYFSSFSDSWLNHVKNYTAEAIERFDISKNSLVAELASNDGYLLQYFNEKEIPVLGIEPAANVAEYAIRKGIPTEVKFFGKATVGPLIKNHGKADLLIGNNVLAHVPDINDFVSAMKLFLKKSGVITMEFPHLMNLIAGNQFDTIYHEHFSYLSFTVVKKIFLHHGLEMFDVKEIPTHGGSLRIYAKHIDDNSKEISQNVAALITKENEIGMNSLKYYTDFKSRVEETKRKILEFLITAKRSGKSIAGYGAPGKGNTLLNYCGIRTDFLDYTVDRNPHKQNNYLPGTLIPIFHPDKIKETKPDYVFILPWNLKKEIMSNLSFIDDWGGKFVVPIPEIKVYEPENILA